MEKDEFFIIKDILQSEVSKYNFTCDAFEKSAVVALTFQNLLGGEIIIINSFVKPLYFNKINDEYYNLVFSNSTYNFANCDVALRDELLENKYIDYLHKGFQITVLQDYLKFIIEHNIPVQDYLRLRDIIPFFEHMHFQNIMDKECDCDYERTLKSVNHLEANMRNNYLNVQKYIFWEQELQNNLEEFENFKGKVLGRKMK